MIKWQVTWMCGTNPVLSDMRFFILSVAILSKSVDQRMPHTILCDFHFIIKCKLKWPIFDFHWWGYLWYCYVLILQLVSKSSQCMFMYILSVKKAHVLLCPSVVTSARYSQVELLFNMFWTAIKLIIKISSPIHPVCQKFKKYEVNPEQPNYCHSPFAPK